MKKNNGKMRYQFLVATEGEKDEPNYLKQLRTVLEKETNETLHIKHLIAETGIEKIFDKLQAELKSKKYYIGNKLYEYAIPCIFVDVDKESHSLQNMQKLINDCKKDGFHLFISHQCLEQWLQYHLRDEIIYKKNGKKEYLKNTLGQEFEKITFDQVKKAHKIAKEKAKSSDDKKYCLYYTGSDIWRFLDELAKKYDALKQHFPTLDFEEL